MLNVFISGVSSEFKEARTKISSQLHGFSNVQFNVTTQESLYDDLSPDANTVSRIIQSLLRQDLIICLIGNDSGFPETNLERINVMSTAKEYLSRELGYSASEFGPIWNGWHEALGMTYTQLEFFVSNLTSNHDSDRKKCVCRFVENNSAASQDEYLTYLKSLREKHLVDWSVFSNENVETVRLAIDYALRRRDERTRIPSDVNLSESITRSLAVCDSDAQQKRLTKSSYNMFYQTVIPRVLESLFVLKKSTRSAGIKASIRKRVLISKHLNQYSVVLQTSNRAAVLRLNEDFQFDYSEHFELNPNDHIVSVSGDGKAILVQREGKWVLPGTENPGYSNSKLQLDTFGGFPAIAMENEPVFRVDEKSDWQFLDQDCIGKVTVSHPPSFPFVEFFRQGSIRLDDSDEANVYMVDASVGIGNSIVLSQILGNCETTIEAKEFEKITLLNIFCVAKKRVNQNYLEFAGPERKQDGTFVILKYPGNPPPQKIRISKGFPKGLQIKNGETGKIASKLNSIFADFDFEKEIELPIPVKFVWLSDAYLLISQPVNKNEHDLFCYAFPKPTGDQGVKFISQLHALIRGESTISGLRSSLGELFNPSS